MTVDSNKWYFKVLQEICNPIYKRGWCLFLCFGLLSFSACNSKIEVIDLKCEYLVSPIGVDAKSPRFTWRMSQSDEMAQSSYCQVIIGTDSVELVHGSNNIWASQNLNYQTVLTVYDGKALKSVMKYFWKVVYFDQDGKSKMESDIASFETGFMTKEEWIGSWISDGKGVDYKEAPYFRREINVSEKIDKARMYISAAGLYELSVNGKKAGDRLLDPMFTRFDKRNLYASLDITSLLKQGDNVIGVELGNGWYNHQSLAVWNYHEASWRNRVRFCAELHLLYKNGRKEIINTDELWKTASGPIQFNSIYTAEHYDAGKELPGWNTSEFDDEKWENSTKVDAPSNNIVSQQLVPIRVTEVLSPVKMNKISDQQYVFHFSENMAGKIDLRVNGKDGTILRIKHGERLDEKGFVDLSNIDYFNKSADDVDPFQVDIVTLKNGENHFSPKFNYKGFQYVEVTSSQSIQLTENSIKAHKMHSDVQQVGYINSSSDLLNSIYKATNRSYLANLFGYPTDCPQREKNGWTGDAHIAIETGLYNYDGITIYEKWMNDFKDAQLDNGVLPCIIPTSGWGFEWANGVDWTGAVAIIPWDLYRFYGDSHALKEMYPSIKLYVDYINSIAPEGITNWGLGDWIPVSSNSSIDLTSSVYYYVVTDILAKAAVVFNEKTDAVQYRALADKIKDAINERFLDPEKGVYCSGNQTELAMPLYWGVVPDEYKDKVALALSKKVESNGFHLDVGLLGTKALLNALSENGYADIAYKVATCQTYPSWGYWIKNGATTLHENWKVDVARDNSYNHIMFGEIGAWMYKGLGGIYPDNDQPGFKHINLRPAFVNGLDEFEAKHKSLYGWISSKWTRIEENTISWEFEIPVNCTATFFPPKNALDIKEQNFSAGKHHLTIHIGEQ